MGPLVRHPVSDKRANNKLGVAGRQFRGALLPSKCLLVILRVLRSGDLLRVRDCFIQFVHR